MNYSTATDGRLLGAPIHDARSTRIVLEEGQLSLSLESEDGQSFEVVFTGCIQTGTRHLRSVLIVDVIYVWPTDSVPDNEMLHPEGAWAVLFSNEIPIDDLPKSVRALLSGRARGCVLVKVETSYGGSISTICRDIGLQVHSSASS